MFSILDLLELRVLQVTTAAIGRAKLQSNRHHQQTNNQLLQARCPSCHPTNSGKELKGKSITFHEFAHPSSATVSCKPAASYPCLLPLKAPIYLGEGCQASRQPSYYSTAI